MRTINKFQTAVVVLVLLTFVSCSDEIISPTKDGNLTKKIPQTEESLSPNVYHTQVRLKPHRSYSLDFSNTGFYIFNSISVLNCGESGKKVEITAYMDDEALVLGCNSQGFEAWSITIQNSTSSFVDLDIILTGSKFKKKTDPKLSEKVQ